MAAPALAGLGALLLFVIQRGLLDWRVWSTIGGAVVFEFFRKNGLRLVQVSVATGVVYAAQNVLMGYFGQISGPLEIVLRNVGVPEGVALIFAGYIWRVSQLGSTVKLLKKP